jgi:hypothetical protein
LLYLTTLYKCGKNEYDRYSHNSQVTQDSQFLSKIHFIKEEK